MQHTCYESNNLYLISPREHDNSYVRIHTKVTYSWSANKIKPYIYNEETFLCIVFISRCFLPPSFGLDDIPFKYVQEERRGTVSIIISSGTGDHPDVTQEMRENWHRNIYFSVFQKISKYSIFHMLFLNQVFNCHCLD